MGGLAVWATETLNKEGAVTELQQSLRRRNKQLHTDLGLEPALGQNDSVAGCPQSGVFVEQHAWKGFAPCSWGSEDSARPLTSHGIRVTRLPRALASRLQGKHQEGSGLPHLLPHCSPGRGDPWGLGKSPSRIGNPARLRMLTSWAVPRIIPGATWQAPGVAQGGG